MSDPTPVDPYEDEAPRKGNVGSKIRLIVLLLILAIFGAALGYDFLVARPSYDEAYKTVEGMVTGRYGPDDVHEAIDKEPAQTRTGENTVFEKYQWRSGMVFRTYSMFVKYEGGLIEGIAQTPPAGWDAAEISE